MKPFAIKTRAACRHCRGGFTLVEMLVSSAIFVIIIGAMVSLQILSLRVYTLSSTKLIATAAGRKSLNDIRDQVRTSKIVYVGTFTNGSFSVIPNGQYQIGNALQIFSTTNTAPGVATVFYVDPVNNQLNWISNGVVSLETKYMTNYSCFQAEDFQGNLLTNYQNNPVIAVTMQFSQWEFPSGSGGSGTNAAAANAYDYYRLHTRITRRAKE